jgi:CRISPR-associated endonuclease/helicase Cas3
LVISDDFLARPKEVADSGLIAHSLKTAKSARELTSRLDLGESPFYAGLLHDLGKLNPFYQELFRSESSSRGVVKKQVAKEYVRAHAIFSALAVYGLTKVKTLPCQTQKQILFAVAGHHSKLTQFCKSLEFCERDKIRFDRSFEGVSKNLQTFSHEIGNIEEFRELNWDLCLQRFKNMRKPLNEAAYVGESKDSVVDFLDFSSVFSALIQADRGSFFEWKPSIFNIAFDTSVLVKTGFPLSDIRKEFQEKVFTKNDFCDNLMVLKAPTGIGKTKIFLDIANRLAHKEKFEHVFYFSPLLALTEDFESKLFSEEKKTASVLKHEDLDKVLVYNHMFTGSLLEKGLKDDVANVEEVEDGGPAFFKTKEYFERESFNKELIVTTTQRLLMVLYSNAPADKEKLLSFRNSFLIIDEVQTIPKFLLPNLIALFRVITKKYNARILLVSATIPDEVRDLPALKTPEDVENKYLQMTAKRIEFKPTFDSSREVLSLEPNERTLFMVNTRRKARKLFEDVSKLKPGIIYLSSGIKKCSRKAVVTDLRASGPATVISTQVMEAGVDVSFTKMYRELAPLDNIVQAMGRLNREGETSTPILSVFNLDGDYKPYSELEVAVSRRLIPELHSSTDIYAKLQDYYKEVSSRNKSNGKLADELEYRMKRLEFDDVWEFIKSNVLPVELGDSIFVPDVSEWDAVKMRFLSSTSMDNKGKLYKLFSGLMAELPRSVEALGLEDSLDQDLLSIGVLMPKKASLSEIYDEKIGLDKWVKPREQT